jgi:REP element-mobilizing transposase RayT
MARGNRKSTIFHDDEDRQQILEVIGHAVDSYDLRVMAFCLMGNHYHVVLETPRCNLSDAMQFVNGVFAQRSNRRHRQTGHVFEGRFRSLVIERDSYFTRAVRYVVRNPVRAGLVDDPSAWRWSSFRATAGLSPVPCWLNVDWTRWAFDTYSFAEARRRYVDYVNGPPEPKNEIDLNAIILGTEAFKTGLLERCSDGADHPEFRVARPTSRPTLEELFDRREGSLTWRDRLIYRARTQHGYRYADIAKFLGIDRSTVSKAAARWHQSMAECGSRRD